MLFLLLFLLAFFPYLPDRRACIYYTRLCLHLRLNLKAGHVGARVCTQWVDGVENQRSKKVFGGPEESSFQWVLFYENQSVRVAIRSTDLGCWVNCPVFGSI